MNYIAKVDKEEYSSPSCSVIEVDVETSILSNEGISIDDWEYADGKL